MYCSKYASMLQEKHDHYQLQTHTRHSSTHPLSLPLSLSLSLSLPSLNSTAMVFLRGRS